MIEGLHGFQKMSKIASSKALVIRVNLVFLALFFVVYVALFLQPSASVYYQNTAVSLIRCSFRDCHLKGKVRLSLAWSLFVYVINVHFHIGLMYVLGYIFSNSVDSMSLFTLYLFRWMMELR